MHLLSALCCSMRGNSGFRILPKDTSACRWERLGSNCLASGWRTPLYPSATATPNNFGVSGVNSVAAKVNPSGVIKQHKKSQHASILLLKIPDSRFLYWSCGVNQVSASPDINRNGVITPCLKEVMLADVAMLTPWACVQCVRFFWCVRAYMNAAPRKISEDI